MYFELMLTTKHTMRLRNSTPKAKHSMKAQSTFRQQYCHHHLFIFFSILQKGQCRSKECNKDLHTPRKLVSN